nr:5-formyltetrahydrofolate cyclo-ligase [Planctomycetota bacterium]
AQLRTRFRRRRRDIDPAQAASEARACAAICAELLAKAATLASYLAMPDEIDLQQLHDAWWASGRLLVVPRVDGGGRLTWHDLQRDDQRLRAGAYGIREPNPDLVPARELPAGAAIIVPGIAFGSDGRRLGQGVGYYDRVLATHRGLSVGVGYSCQRCDDLPLEPHDRPVAAVVLGSVLVLVPPRALPA